MTNIKKLSMLLLIAIFLAACTQTGSPTTQPATATQTAVSPAKTTQESLPSATPTGAWMILVPDTGKAGDKVTIEGYLPGGPTAAEAANDPNLLEAEVCWDGCQSGLQEISVPLTWSANEAGHFRSELLVPPIAWNTSQGPKSLVEGNYTVSMLCLGPEISGCALQPGDPTTTFHLQSSTDQRCQPGQPCASLTFTPTGAAPGEIVEVSGWAPLDQILAGEAWGYDLNLTDPATGELYCLTHLTQDLNGDLRGNFLVPASLPSSGILAPGSYPIALSSVHGLPVDQGGPQLLAETTFELKQSQGWAGLSEVQPSWIAFGSELMNPRLAQDPVDANRLAYCAPGEIKLSTDGGSTWSSVPTSHADQALAGSVYGLADFGSGQPVACLDISLDPVHPDSFYVTFQVVNKDYGAPPVYYMGFATSDKGKTWQLVPPADPDLKEAFGGFWTDGQGTVQALYPMMGGSETSPTALVQESWDGGKTWQAGSLICPISQPCLRWGPAGGMIGGMGSPLPQGVLASQDGGQNWLSTPVSVELRMGGVNSLITLPDNTALLAAGSESYPLRRSADGGLSWEVMSLPPLPNSEFAGTYPGLQMLPDGSLISQSTPAGNSSGEWAVLPPGGSVWCPVSAALPGVPVTLRFTASQALWYDPISQSIGRAPLADFACP